MDKPKYDKVLIRFYWLIMMFFFINLGVLKAYVADARKDTGMREIYRDEV